MGDPYYEEWHRPHEARFHNSVFDTVSRPLSRQSSNQSRNQNHAFADTKIPWDHYGKRLRIYLTKQEIERGGDLFQLVLNKAREQIPNFQGVLAYNNYGGRQIILYNDADIRRALHEMGQKLKLYSTVVPDKGYIAAADIRGGRSQSVPPQQNRYSPEGRAPSSMDSNYQYRDRSQHPQGAPPPRPPYTPGSGSYVHSQSYGQPLLYGMPPQNMLLAHFLTGGHYPFTKFSWVGPNKYHNFGPYPYKHFYNKGGWGPSW
ncbi:unnamed protein product [Bursaphelenchus xylophilus]|uniref:(pine wood nematode) hypothetical protein n=1 Tax=Bursaphelenchus xylophilus TaxID=6326 RepID=A0A1I7RNQ6_BURXY|nr:unnamed protein product [Bursaphelenchus xylophilus]CAG9124224.1 unnamed protein product [Bursaphelenchus xylophilus]